MSRVHVLIRTALVTRRSPEVGDYPVHRRAGETTWNREIGGVPSHLPRPFSAARGGAVITAGAVGPA
jgi:hypothetical protein